MKTFRQIPSQAVCGRCAMLFVYFRTTRHRLICTPCIPLDKQESNKFSNTWRAVKRIEAQRAREQAA